MARKRWSDLTPVQCEGFTWLGVVQVALPAAATTRSRRSRLWVLGLDSMVRKVPSGQHPHHRQLQLGRCPPQQRRTRACGGRPSGVAVEVAVRGQQLIVTDLG